MAKFGYIRSILLSSKKRVKRSTKLIKLMATVKNVLVKGRCNRNGRYPLVVQVLHKRKKKVIYTGFSIAEKWFDPISGKVINSDGNSPETVRRINRKCENISKKLLKAIYLMEKEYRGYEIEEVFRVYEILTSEIGLCSYFALKIQELRENGHEGTARAYTSTLHSMQRYLEKDLPFRKITSQVIARYHKRLLDSGICDNTAGFYLHNIKAVYI